MNPLPIRTARCLPAHLDVRFAVAVGAALCATSALADQYKVVNPDGSVTYTDRAPPASAGVRVLQISRSGAPVTVLPVADSLLPIELRQAMQRYPVTLYTAPDCEPCERGRALLEQRGIPYSERRALTNDDVRALERIAGARTVPALTIGQQPLRGYSEADWMAYLDAAGYPRESRLPRDWQPAPATPIVARASATPRARPAATPAPAARPAAEQAPEPAPGLRF